MKNICFLEGDISRSGGTERVTSIIANELAKRKDEFNILILSICKRNDQLFFYLEPNIKITTVFAQPDYNGKKEFFKIVYKIRKFLKENSVDILIDVDTILDIYGIPATRFNKTKIVSWEHFNFYENLGIKLRDYGRKLAAKYSDVIVTLTKEDKNYFKQNLKIKHNIYTIYNPLILTKKNNDYDLNSKIILSAGRLTYQKGFDMLVEVAKEVLMHNDEWKWIILGEGEDRKKLETQIHKYGLDGKVILKGNVEDIDSFYDKASIFVLTSRFEGFGLVLTEAKTFKLPCISFKCKAGPNEIILNDVNGYLIESFDLNEMAEKIRYLINSELKRKQFSDNALNDTEKFQLDFIKKQWIDLLNNL
ncbi:glycosyltransferase family 4 protein [Thomasclavelia cocleata]|uniref:glycosyltransferase family 4 protein n=1 Tax=Thomasclavelia cocleata TaxID=69824 RepID=UPI002431C6B3|nr:glycosyltransferase family 4 protein [Thomasclavelia cocleata]